MLQIYYTGWKRANVENTTTLHTFSFYSVLQESMKGWVFLFIVTVDVKKSYLLDFPIVNFLSNFASFIGFYFENQSQSWWVVVIWIMHAHKYFLLPLQKPQKNKAENAPNDM